MKVLIVDDEKYVRDCINLLADWTLCGVDCVFEAETVQEAMACVELELPQLIITDIRMPQHDGVELMAWLHEKYPELQVVVISAFNEFDYAVSAMRYGALDYLLKPIRPKQLNEVLKKASSIFHSQQESEDESGFNLDTNERIMLALLAEGDAVLPTHSRLHQIFAAPLGLLVLDLFCAPAAADRSKTISVKQLLKDISTELRKKKGGWAFHGVSYGDMLYVLLTEDSQIQLQTAHFILDHVRIVLGGEISYVLRCNGVWNVSTFPSVAENAVDTIQDHVLLECYPGIPFRLPENFEVFFMALAHGNIQKAHTLVEQWVVDLQNVQSLTRKNFKTWWESLCTACGNFMENQPKYQGQYPAFLTQQLLLPILNTQCRLMPVNLLEWVERQMLTLADNFGILQAEGIDLTSKIEQEIQMHYSEPISLTSIAAKFYRNPSYIARIFKKHYQVSVVNYIINVRIHEAKILLKTTDYRIAKIAHMVGYTDEKYFCRIFKKTVGLSPGEYRKI